MQTTGLENRLKFRFLPEGLEAEIRAVDPERMNSAEAPTAVSYSGYRVDRRGACVWPQATPKYRWEDLTAVNTWPRADRRGFTTEFRFRTGRRWQLSGAKAFGFSNSPGRFAEVLACARAGAPETAKFNGLTRDIADWGPRAVRARLKAESGRQCSADELVEQARNHLAWVEPNKALRAVEAALQREPDHRAALKLRLQLLFGITTDRAKILAAARRWLEACPRETEAQSAIYSIGLDGDDAMQAEPATQWLRDHPDDLPLAMALAAFHFRRKEYTQAETAWGICRPPADQPEVQEAVRGQIAFIRRYASDGRYRLWSQTKRWSLLVLPGGFLALFIVVKLTAAYQWWGRSDPAQPTPERQEEIRHMREFIAANERRMQELTGLVSGDFSALKRRADAGEATAQYTVSFRYFRGDLGAPKDEAAGLRYLELAAAQHYRHAVIDLAERLDESTKPENQARAAGLLEEAARLGSGRAAAQLGRHYLEGKGVAKDQAKAFAWFEKGAEDNNLDAIELAGWALEGGKGVEKNLPRALEYYRRAAEKQSVWAKERLVAGLYQPKATKEELNECWKWTLAGAKEGSKNLRQFAAWDLIVVGQQATPAEERQVFDWMRESAEAGEANDEAWLSELYWEGIGAPHDQHKAVEWLTKAAAQKHIRSVRQLAQCQAFGVATLRDLTAARANRDLLAAYPELAKPVGDLDNLLEVAAKPPSTAAADGDQKARPIFRLAPHYPMKFRRQGVSGEALVEFYVNEDGFTRDLKVVRASRPEFGYAAVNALSFWRFTPGTEHGKPMSQSYQQLITFTLNDEAEPPKEPASKTGQGS